MYIDESNGIDTYYCPFCKGKMIRKLGSVNTHHYAHKSHAECDPWYYNHPGKGFWHKSMQAMFPKNCQEVKIYADDNPSVCHFADVFVERKDRNNIVIEFQHSTISWEVFRERTLFYRQNRCNCIEGKKQYNAVVWVFDCLEKKLYINDIVDDPGCIHVEWPGRDRIRFLGDYLPEWEAGIYVIFHAIKNKFEIVRRDSDFGTYDSYVFWYDPDRKPIFANVISEDNEYRSFDAEEVANEKIVDYIIKWL